MSTTQLTYCGNLQYSTWREADKSEWYNLEEHHEPVYEISVVIRYIIEAEQRFKEERLWIESEDVFQEMMLSEVDDLRTKIEETLRGFGVGQRDVGVREKMVDALMKEIWDEGVNHCRCYCHLITGPQIVMEIVEIADAQPAWED